VSPFDFNAQIEAWLTNVANVRVVGSKAGSKVTPKRAS